MLSNKSWLGDVLTWTGGSSMPPPDTKNSRKLRSAEGERGFPKEEHANHPVQELHPWTHTQVTLYTLKRVYLYREISKYVCRHTYYFIIYVCISIYVTKNAKSSHQFERAKEGIWKGLKEERAGRIEVIIL